MSFEQIKLGEVIKHRKGFITIDDNKEYKLCRVQLHRRGVLLREVVKGSTIRTKKQQVCKAGDFLVAEMDAKVGGYGFVPNELDGAIVSSHYFLFELDKSKIRPKYLEVISQLLILQDQIKAVGSTNYAAIRPANVLNWDIPITNINKQKEIEKLFDSTRAIGNNLSSEFSNQVDLLTQLRQSFLREAMKGKLVKQDPKDGHAKDLLEKIKAEKAKSGKKDKELPPIKPEEIPFEIPENWVWCRLGEILSEIKYGTSQSCDYDSTKNSAILRIPNISSGVINGEDLKFTNLSEREKRELSLEENDILIIRSNGSRELVGRTVLVTEKFIGYAYAGYLVRLRFNKTLINPNYLWLVSMSPFFRELIEIPLRTTVGINNINTDEMSKLLIPIPPHSIQTRIAKKLDELLRFCDGLQESIQVSGEQNELLLQQVLKEALTIKE